MHIVLLCATARGLRVLDRMAELLNRDDRLTVFTFREEPHEPPFTEAITARAREAGAELIVTKQVGGSAAAKFWETARPDLLIAVSWRYMVPREIYSLARAGALAFHDSLLPAYRGFAPTVWAVVNGENHTGATLFHMVDGVDEGDVVDQRRVPIGPDDTIADVIPRVTDAYLELLTAHLRGLLNGTAPRLPQDSAHATYTCRWLPADSQIRWSDTADRVYNLIRGVTAPYPGAFTTLGGRKLTVWAAARPVPAHRYVAVVPGRVVRFASGGAAEVLAGDGSSLLLTRVQLDGDEPRAAGDVLTKLSDTLGT